MSRHVSRARDYVDHMLLACEKIQRYIDGMSENDFYVSEAIQDAVMRNVGNLGEAAKKFLNALPDAAIRFPAIPFSAIYAMRNRIIHGYEDMKIERVWESAFRERPPLQAAIETALASWPSDLA